MNGDNTLWRAPFSTRGNKSAINLPGNSEYVLLCDSTYGIPTDAQAIASSATDIVPGGDGPNSYVGGRLMGWILSTGQDVTAYFQIRTGVAGTAADWTTDPSGPGTAGVMTVTAGTVSNFSWRPNARDFRILVVAGATGPTTLTAEANLIFDRGT